MIEDKKEMHRALFEYLHSRIVLDDELEKFYETFVWDAFIEEVIENFGVKINEFAAEAIKKTVDIINNKKKYIMKVIENNYYKPSWRTVCPKCKSVLEYDSDDVIIKESYFFSLHYIQCPCCKKNIDVEQW